MYYLYFFGSALASIFPRRLSYLIAKFISIGHYYTSKKDREAVTHNLSPIAEDKGKLKRWARGVFINFAYYLVDFFRYSRLNQDFIDKYVKISGRETLDKAMAEGRGVIILTAHLGNYELAGAILSLLGYPLSVVALSHKEERVNRFFDGQRQKTGMKVISTGSAIRGCFSVLKKGKVLGLLGDRDFSGRGIKLKMFSQCAYFPRGAAFFALKTGAPIIPIFLIRENKIFYRLILEEPIIYNQDRQSEVDVINSCNLVLEKYIKRYPQQWYMFQRYWSG